MLAPRSSVLTPSAMLLRRRRGPTLPGTAPETLRYGVSVPTTKGRQTALSVAWIPYLPSHQAGTLDEVRAFFSVGGSIKIFVLRPDGYTWTRVAISSSITATSGLNTFTPSDFGVVNVQVGDVVGFFSEVASVTYFDSDGYGCFSLDRSGEPTASGNVLSFSPALRNWQFGYTVTGVSAPSQTLFSEPFEHTGIPWDWEHESGAWTHGTGKATSGTEGIANSLNYRFHIGNLAQWTWTANFTFDTSGARFCMATRNVVQTTGGYCIEVNSGTGNMVVYRTTGQNGWSNLSGLSAVTTQATGITFATGVEYVMSITKSWRSTTVTISEAANPSVTYTLSWDQEDATNGAIQTRGFGYGKPCFAAIAGTVSVLGTTFTVPDAQPDWLFIGDSITEGSGVTSTTLGYPRLIAAARAATLTSSAQGGASTLFTPARLAAELAHIRPKNVHLLIGTNDTVAADWKSKVGGMRDYLSGLTNVYVGSVPAEAADTNPEIEFNPHIQTQGWATVRHDLALTNPATGLGANRNAALYFDKLHPNADGNAAMAARFAVDVP